MISIAEERCEEIEKKDDLIFGLFEQVDQLKDNVEILQHVSKPRGYELLVQKNIRKRFVMWWHMQETEILVHFWSRFFSNQSPDRKCS